MYYEYEINIFNYTYGIIYTVDSGIRPPAYTDKNAKFPLLSSYVTNEPFKLNLELFRIDFHIDFLLSDLNARRSDALI